LPIANGLYYFTYQGLGAGMLPVVLIHGAGGTHLYWPPQIRRLAGCRVFALDLPGHGKSAGDRGCQSIAEYTRNILEWMEFVGLHRAVFVGHSMGGGIALNLGLDYPERVLGLGLLSTGAQLKVNPGLLEEASNPATYSRAVEQVVKWSFGPQTPENLLNLANRSMLGTRQSVFYGDLLACDAFDVMDRLAEISSPTLVICGDQDKMTPVRANQHVASQIPGARVELIVNAGHMVMLERPEIVASLLADFISQIQYQYGDAL
jgi:pimeloyl-ACP methyl ester carboxylesterase